MDTRSRTIKLATVAVACLFASSMASAKTVLFTIQGDTVNNFQFSLFHDAASNPDEFGQNMSGNVLTSLNGTFLVDVDETAQTLTFTDFNGILGNGGSVSLGTGATNVLNYGVPEDNAPLSTLNGNSGGGELVNGGLSLDIFDSSNTLLGTLNYDFQAFEYNTLANQFFNGDNPFNTDTYALGLWDATSNPDNIGFSAAQPTVGLDLFATGTFVPLPPAAAAGLLGLGVVGMLRRRKNMALAS